MEELTLEQIEAEASYRLQACESIAVVGLGASLLLAKLSERQEISDDLRETGIPFLSALAAFLLSQEDRLHELRRLYQERDGEVADLEKLLGSS